jgi:hypothetical protein
MSGGQRSKNYRPPILGIACGVILLAGLAASSYRHHAAKAAGTRPLETNSASKSPALLPLFAVSPPPPATSHVSKFTPSAKSAASALARIPHPSHENVCGAADDV